MKKVNIYMGTESLKRDSKKKQLIRLWIADILSVICSLIFVEFDFGYDNYHNKYGRIIYASAHVCHADPSTTMKLYVC